jgi:hypothetical protein
MEEITADSFWTKLKPRMKRANEAMHSEFV